MLAGTHKVQCRQTLVGGWYELLNSKQKTNTNEKINLIPNPDFWTAILWKRLMGSASLFVTSNNTDVLAFAHCTSGSNSGISFALVNTNPNITYQIDFGIPTT